MKPADLTYCTNVHALGDFASWERVIGYFGPAIRERLAWTRLPMGLWFPAALLEEIDRDPEAMRARVRGLLADHGLGTFTLNAFPYGNFHDKVVKTKVYSPDWTDARRLDYTVACARLLASLLPAGAEGSISTLPLGWRIGWTAEHSRRAASRLCAFAREAMGLASREGRIIRLGLEPEPGCALETTPQAIAFWEDCLRPAAREAGLSEADLSAHLGLCYDTCHQAVQFEDACAVLDALAAAGIPIVKMQLSSALEFKPDPAGSGEALRRAFCEERFLHQTRILTPDGLVSFDDLPDALAVAGAAAGGGRGPASGSRAVSGPDWTAESPARGKDRGIDLWAHPWRVHFHVPIDAPGLLDPARIGTTRDEMIRAYRHARARGLCRHFEVETYTWSVMPEAHRPATEADLADSIARELRFVAALEAGSGGPGGSAAAGGTADGASGGTAGGAVGPGAEG